MPNGNLYGAAARRLAWRHRRAFRKDRRRLIRIIASAIAFDGAASCMPPHEAESKGSFKVSVTGAVAFSTAGDARASYGNVLESPDYLIDLHIPDTLAAAPNYAGGDIYIVSHSLPTTGDHPVMSIVDSGPGRRAGPGQTYALLGANPQYTDSWESESGVLHVIAVRADSGIVAEFTAVMRCTFCRGVPADARITVTGHFMTSKNRN